MGFVSLHFRSLIMAVVALGYSGAESRLSWFLDFSQLNIERGIKFCIVGCNMRFDIRFDYERDHINRIHTENVPRLSSAVTRA